MIWAGFGPILGVLGWFRTSSGGLVRFWVVWAGSNGLDLLGLV